MTDTMTAQEVFDTAAKHLITQGVRASSSSGACFYRGPMGTKCAVGALITDEEYDPDWEENSVDGITGKPGFPSRLRPHSELLTDLQLLHDEDDPDGWRASLRELAEFHGLSCAVLN